MSRIVSYAFFRNDQSAYESERCGVARGRFFVTYLPAIIRTHRSVYPEFRLMVHHDDRAREFPYFKALERFHERGMLKLVYCGEAKRLCEAMLWRMRPIWDEPDSEVVVCRDIDSLSTPRERGAVLRWIDTSSPIHGIHDSASHNGATLMGGLCAFKAGYVRKKYSRETWLSLVERFDLSAHGSDQHFLNAVFASDDILLDNTKTIGPNVDPRDSCAGHARHCGGAYHAEPVRQFYDIHYPDQDVMECERGQ